MDNTVVPPEMMIFGLCHRCGEQYIKDQLEQLHDCGRVREALPTGNGPVAESYGKSDS